MFDTYLGYPFYIPHFLKEIVGPRLFQKIKQTWMVWDQWLEVTEGGKMENRGSLGRVRCGSSGDSYPAFELVCLVG